MRISDWSSDVCSSDLVAIIGVGAVAIVVGGVRDAGGAAAVVIAVAAVALLRGAIAIEGILEARQLRLEARLRLGEARLFLDRLRRRGPCDGGGERPGCEESGRASCRERVCQDGESSV